MKIHYGWDSWDSHFYPGTAVSVGNFDGVHLGHQAILKRARELAVSASLPLVVLTFDPVPKKVLYPETAPPLIQTLEQRLRSLQQNHVDHTIIVVFSKDFSLNTPHYFVEEFLVRRLRVRYLVVGRNFSFGHDKQGNVALLQEMGKKYDFQPEGIPEIWTEGVRVSSTLIRKMVAEGKVEEAQKYLGRPFALIGNVVRGEKLGGKLGIPTANLDVENELLPGRGVYITRTEISGELFPSVTNVGIRPTVGGKKLTVETHLLNFSRDLYQWKLEIHFLKRIRDEKLFASGEDLKQQILADVCAAEAYFRFGK